MHDGVFILHRGDAPLLVSLPHDGTALPPELAERMTDAARAVPDTDWHVSRLYAFVRELGASMLVPRFSRYVVDLNRPPDDASLYPGQNTTGLCPALRFSGDPVYLPGREPSEGEVRERVERYWRPYHDALQSELERLRARHGDAEVSAASTALVAAGTTLLHRMETLRAHIASVAAQRAAAASQLQPPLLQLGAPFGGQCSLRIQIPLPHRLRLLLPRSP